MVGARVPVDGEGRSTLWCLALCAAAVFSAAAASADERSPLQPPDRSSPRDTIEGFLRDLDPVIERFRAGQRDLRAVHGEFRRAMGALDYSTTPHGHTGLVRMERVLMLVDVLDRIGLPPSEQIPGDEEVAREGLAIWTIPGSEIRLRRIERPGKDSAFLFAPETVERLDRYHRRTQKLASRRGLPCLVDAFFTDDSADQARARLIRSRLKRVDTSSPRSTLEGFLESVNRAFAIVQETEAGLQADPPTLTREEALEAEYLAGSYLARARSTLDLSEVPAANRQDVGLETALQLKEILDRLVLPPFDAIPNELRVKQQRRAGTSTTWLYPNTEIEIVEVEEGEDQGHFLFSAKSVERVPEFYERVAEFPYRDFWAEFASDFRSPQVSPGFYDYYVGTPGFLIPGASPLGSLVEALPEGMKRVRFGQTLWQWLGLVITMVITPLGVLLIARVLARSTRRLEEPARSWLSIVAPAVGAVVFFEATVFVDNDLNITGSLLTFAQAGGRAIATALAVWAVFKLAVAVAEQIIDSPRVADVGFNANLIRIGARVVGFVLGIWIVIAVLRDLGVDLLPLIAGLGVGGLAVALAAQRAFANFLGGFLLYLNKPVRVGDFCLFGDGKMGTVEEIGLLSTRIRTLERSLLTVPNADFSEYELDNLATRDRRLFKTVLQLRYETSPRQLRYVIAKLRELLANHPRVEPEPRVRFTNLGEYSLDVEIFAYLSCQDQSVYLAIREDILLQIVNLVEEAGTEFAFPSQVEYQAQATAMDAERSKDAEAQVDRWWAEGRLARPGFEERRPDQGDETTGYLHEGRTLAPVPSEPEGEDPESAGIGADDAARSRTGGPAR